MAWPIACWTRGSVSASLRWSRRRARLGSSAGRGAARGVGRGLREGEELPIRSAAGTRGLGRQVLGGGGPPPGALEVAMVRGETRGVLGLAQEAQQHADAIEEEG